MNFKLGGKGALLLCDTKLYDNLVGDDAVEATIYESITEGSLWVGSLNVLFAKERVFVKMHD